MRRAFFLEYDSLAISSAVDILFFEGRQLPKWILKALDCANSRPQAEHCRICEASTAGKRSMANRSICTTDGLSIEYVAKVYRRISNG